MLSSYLKNNCSLHIFKTPPPYVCVHAHAHTHMWYRLCDRARALWLGWAGQGTPRSTHLHLSTAVLYAHTTPGFFWESSYQASIVGHTVLPPQLKFCSWYSFSFILNYLHEGKQDISAGASTCCQAWRPEFKPGPHLMEGETQPFKWFSDLLTHSVTCINTHIHK